MSALEVKNKYFILSNSGLKTTACAMNFPEEIIEMVLCHLSGKDLMQLCLAGKSFSNVLLFPKPWKEACLRDFDAEFFEDTDWILFYRKQAKIRRNVLDKR